MSNKYNKCPICNTDKFVTYIMGSHAEGRPTIAEGRPTIAEGREHYVQGDCVSHESYECDKCGGEFSVHYEIHNGKTEYLKVDYSGSRTNKSGFHAWA